MAVVTFKPVCECGYIFKHFEYDYNPKPPIKVYAADAEEGDIHKAHYIHQSQSPEVIDSKTDGSLGENVIIASVVNRFKNYFGKARVVVIQSQLGDPICAYSGDSVYYEVCEDLPKTTKLMIDGKALYIHRANFQIIDKELLD